MKNSIAVKLNKIALYTVAYIFIFLLLSLIMPYILPFLLGLIIALLAQRPINFLSKNLKLKRGLVGLLIVLLIFGGLVTIITFIIIGIVNELISLSTLLSNYIINLPSQGYNIGDIISSYYHSIDPSVIDAIKGFTDKIFTGSFTAAKFVISLLLDLLKSLPGILMLILFTLIASIYIAIDLPRLKEKFFSLFSEEHGSSARNIIFQSNKMISNYFRAYMILISITFVETYIGTSILKFKYSLLLALATSISDALPVFGPGAVLIPTGIGYIITGSYVKGIGTLIIYLIITVVRQILEPRIVSSSLGVYPLAILAAIFIGLKAHGFTGMVFTVFYVIFYVVLDRVGLFSDNNEIKDKK